MWAAGLYAEEIRQERHKKDALRRRRMVIDSGRSCSDHNFFGGGRMIKRTLGFAVLFSLVASISLQAHHSLAGVYDMKKEVEMSGSLDSVKFVNPHGSLTILVKNADGSTTPWVLTLGS